MLTVDLVRVRRRNGALEIIPLSKAARGRSVQVAEQYINQAKSHIGRTRGELDEAMSAISVHAADRKITGGLRKLIADRCKFDVEEGSNPIELRRDVFRRASAARRQLEAGQRFEPAEVIAKAAAERELEPAELKRLLYVDLRTAHRLLAFDGLPPSVLIELYELGQAQAVLLRASRMVARVRCSAAGVYRALFNKLKFRRLLHTIEPIADDSEWAGGYRITIDGPYSMFRAINKYGLQLAHVLPALRACERWDLEAEILWGKERKPFSFSTGNDQPVQHSKAGSSGLPSEVQTLLERFRERHKAKKTKWQAKPSTDILHLPGAGVCVPDLIFEHEDTGVCIYLEVMGFWSRDAVWNRVELVEKGLPQQILFAVSSRLRVSEAALDSELPSALYVYKGAMSQGIIEQRLSALAGV